MAKKNLLLEESIFIGLDDNYNMVDKPLSSGVFKIIGLIVFFIFLIVFFRVAYFQVFLSSQYKDRASINAGQHIILKGPRGIIYDRYGEPLLKNKPTFEVNVNLSQILKDRSKIKETLESVNKIIPFDITKIESEIINSDLERQAYYPIARNVPLDQIIELKKIDSPAIAIENNFSREYIDGPTFAQILGYTSLVNKDDLNKDKNLKLNDDIGKAGLELQYDDYLRGKDGLALKYKDAKGENIDDKTVSNPVTGNGLYTTIDAGLQKVFYNTLKDQLSSLGRTSGAGLAIDPQNGEVLSLVSLPSYDNNNLTSDLFIDKQKPLFNRIISGLYSPGSTIKPLVAVAALEEKIVDPLKSFLSIGYIELPNPYNPDKPSRFLDWKANGWVNMYSALAKSSNIYFYYIGGGFEEQKGLGIYKLQEYWKKFGLDKKTGIDYPNEATGVLADPEIKEKRTGQIWRIGDTYNVSIGQGDLMITPLELLRYISSVANGGKLPTPYFVKEIKDSFSNIIKTTMPTVYNLDIQDFQNIEEAKLGMIDGVNKDYGTSHSLSSIPMKLAGKTGSAQIQNNQKTNAFFVGFNIPDNNENSNQQTTDKKFNSAPQQIAILVLIEDAKEGSLNAVPVGKKIFEWYYENRIKK